MNRNTKLIQFLMARLKHLRREERGAITMEYVLLCVLVAAAALFAVITFSRAVFSGLHVATYAMTAQPERAAEAQTLYRQDRAKDAEQSYKWSEALHK